MIDINILTVGSTGIFMDYIFILNVGWIVLEIISNINLKQSTFKVMFNKYLVELLICDTCDML